VLNPHLLVPLTIWSTTIKFERLTNHLRVNLHNLLLPSTPSSSRLSPSLSYQWVDIDLESLKRAPQLIDFPIYSSEMNAIPSDHIYVQLSHIYMYFKVDHQWFIVCRVFNSHSLEHLPLKGNLTIGLNASLVLIDTNDIIPEVGQPATFINSRSALDHNILISASRSTVWKVDKMQEHLEWMLFAAANIRHIPLTDTNTRTLSTRTIRICQGAATSIRSPDESMFIFVAPSTLSLPCIEMDIRHRVIASRKTWIQTPVELVIPLVLPYMLSIKGLVDIIVTYYYDLDLDRSKSTKRVAEIYHGSYIHRPPLLPLELHNGVLLDFQNRHAQIGYASRLMETPIAMKLAPVYIRSYGHGEWLIVVTKSQHDSMKNGTDTKEPADNTNINECIYYMPLDSTCRPYRYIHPPSSSTSTKVATPAAAASVVSIPPPMGAQPLPDWLLLPTSQPYVVSPLPSSSLASPSSSNVYLRLQWSSLASGSYQIVLAQLQEWNVPFQYGNCYTHPYYVLHLPPHYVDMNKLASSTSSTPSSKMVSLCLDTKSCEIRINDTRWFGSRADPLTICCLPSSASSGSSPTLINDDHDDKDSNSGDHVMALIESGGTIRMEHGYRHQYPTAVVAQMF
jgi:hypothetical protein